MIFHLSLIMVSFAVVLGRPTVQNARVASLAAFSFGGKLILVICALAAAGLFIPPVSTAAGYVISVVLWPVTFMVPQGTLAI